MGHEQVWNVPYSRNPVFTGRESLLVKLAEALHTDEAAALTQPQAISGLGGIGKTQIALEYAYRFRGDYQTVLWVQADTSENLTSSYLALAGLLNLPEKDEQESARVVAAVKNWLERTSNWLLILDNADELTLARDFLPPSRGGHVLLTTRAHTTGRFARRVEVDILSAEVGALFLLRRSGLLSPNAPFEQASEDEQKVAYVICEQLGGLPLALDQAGAYIEETGCSLAEYEHLFRQRRADLLAERRGLLVNDHPDPVATTWSLSFEKVEQKSPAAADLLRLCACLAPDAIPETIVMQGAQYLGEHLAPVGGDLYLLNQVIEVLHAYSLLSREVRPAYSYLSVHRLVQAVLKDHMDEQEKHQWAERTLRAVKAALPAVEHQTWTRWEQILPHALCCRDLIAQDHLPAAEATRVLQQTGWYLIKRVRYQEAELLLTRALSISKKEHGVEHLDTARDSLTLAYLYNRQGKYAEAEPLLKHALSVVEQQLGSEHPGTAASLNNLAWLYKAQGHYAKAELLYHRAFSIYERLLGPEHSNTAVSINNLAESYRTQGKYAEAEPLLKRALLIREQQLGSEHPDTATSLCNLAELYSAQGKYAEAEPLLKRALLIREQQLGSEHPDTAISLKNVAMLYYYQEKYVEAELLLKHALAIDTKIYDIDHPDILTNLSNIAGLYNAQGKTAEAESLMKHVLLIREQRLGPEHPDTVISLNNLAVLYYYQEKYVEAEPLLKRALLIREQQLGSEHLSTQAVRADYISLLHTVGRYEEAKELEQKQKPL